MSNMVISTNPNLYQIFAKADAVEESIKPSSKKKEKFNPKFFQILKVFQTQIDRLRSLYKIPEMKVNMEYGFYVNLQGKGEGYFDIDNVSISFKDRGDYFTAHVESLYINKKESGLGSAILDAIKNTLLEVSPEYYFITLYSVETALLFYIKNGFRPQTQFLEHNNRATQSGRKSYINLLSLFSEPNYIKPDIVFKLIETFNEQKPKYMTLEALIELYNLSVFSKLDIDDETKIYNGIKLYQRYFNTEGNSLVYIHEG